MVFLFFFQVASKAVYLADAMYVYGTALHELSRGTGQVSSDGKAIMAAAKGSYEGD